MMEHPALPTRSAAGHAPDYPLERARRMRTCQFVVETIT